MGRKKFIQLDRWNRKIDEFTEDQLFEPVRSRATKLHEGETTQFTGTTLLKRIRK